MYKVPNKQCVTATISLINWRVFFYTEYIKFIVYICSDFFLLIMESEKSNSVYFVAIWKLSLPINKWPSEFNNNSTVVWAGGMWNIFKCEFL